MSEDSRYKYKEQEVNYHGVKQRWLIVLSEMRQKAEEEKIEKKVKKERKKNRETVEQMAGKKSSYSG